MRLGKRTARLVREAIILAHVEGMRYGRAVSHEEQQAEGYPRDSTVITTVLQAAKSFRDIYPMLSKVEREDLDQ